MVDRLSRELVLRILSGFILAPPAIAAIYYGSPWFEALIVVVCSMMAWEWQRVRGGGHFRSGDWPIIAVVWAVVALAIAQLYAYSLLALAVGLIALYGVETVRARPDAVLGAGGALIVGLPCLAALWLRFGEFGGSFSLLWIVGVVWTTDIAAYVAGRSIGGPRLAPRISPGKTWAGLAGGVVAGAMFSLFFGQLVDGTSPAYLAILGAVVACLAQAGDLMISIVKRRYGQKDASGLIPGHGGVLDRLDGLLTTAPALAVLAAATSGGELRW